MTQLESAPAMAVQTNDEVGMNQKLVLELYFSTRELRNHVIIVRH